MPARLTPELSFSTIEYTSSGLVVPFSSLEVSEVLQVQFIVAWDDMYTNESISTWFAVE